MRFRLRENLYSLLNIMHLRLILTQTGHIPHVHISLFHQSTLCILNQNKPLSSHKTTQLSTFHDPDTSDIPPLLNTHPLSLSLQRFSPIQTYLSDGRLVMLLNDSMVESRICSASTAKEKLTFLSIVFKFFFITNTCQTYRQFPWPGPGLCNVESIPTSGILGILPTECSAY